jgi:hypothetical protein
MPKAKAMADIVGIYRLPIGVGVAAKSPWAATTARDAVEISSKEGSKTASFDSKKAIEDYAKVARGEVQHDAALWDKAGHR